MKNIKFKERLSLNSYYLPKDKSTKRNSIAKGILPEIFTNQGNWLITWEEIRSWHSSVSGSVMSDSLWPNGLQHARIPCPSPTPRACSNSCPLSQWCHPTISSSVIPFCLQSFWASGSFLMSQLFASGDQSTGISALESPK